MSSYGGAYAGAAGLPSMGPIIRYLNRMNRLAVRR